MINNLLSEQQQQLWNNLLEELELTFGRKPDIQSLLFLIGVQELGQTRNFTKEEKQDLMHVGVCHLLSLQNYYQFSHRDEEGWPHYAAIKPAPELTAGVGAQENLLQFLVLQYFNKI